ncbi:MAG: hypothetical protein IT372_24155 [Polyangiaceae bacterium]|nr:hypothetical protein [Polyangiaceae bacterium]
MTKKWILGGAAALAAALGALLVPVGGGGEAQSAPREKVEAMDLSALPDTKPEKPLRMLFIHHSCGGQLLADPGPDVDPAQDCIYTSHSNGGGLKKLLTQNGYEVHEASYGSAIGEDTDMFHWLPKFRDKMETVLKVSHQDQLYPDDKRNQIVAFKSCFPNNEFVGEGTAPGDPKGPDLTVWNAKASLSALLPELKKHPEVLFVYVTAPPIAPRPPKVRLYKYLMKKVRGQSAGPTVEEIAKSADLARQFNGWVVSKDGWLKDYPEKNVVVFDYYDALTNHGQSNLLAFPTKGGHDSHPARVGNERAAAAFVPFINRAVRRAGLGN